MALRYRLFYLDPAPAWLAEADARVSLRHFQRDVSVDIWRIIVCFTGSDVADRDEWAVLVLRFNSDGATFLSVNQRHYIVSIESVTGEADSMIDLQSSLLSFVVRRRSS